MTDDAGTESDATDGEPADATENPEMDEDVGTDGGCDGGRTDSDTSGENGNGDGAPHIDLSMYQLSVSVRGSGDDGLDDVSEAARDLMDYLAEKSVELEERPDDRGLG